MANWQIPITENGKTTLATAGKYCDRNIDVNVDIPKYNGEIAWQIPEHSRYATIQDALSETNVVYGGAVGGFTDGNGQYHVVLHSDISSSVAIPVTRDCIVHLRGHILSLTAEGAYLNITTAGAVTIDGTVPGSEIKKEIASATSATSKVIFVNDSHLTINGGTYSQVVNGGTKAAIVIDINDYSPGVIMNGCTVSIDCPNTGLCIQYYASAPIKLTNCTLTGVSRTSGNMLGVSIAMGSGYFENCNVSVKSAVPGASVRALTTNAPCTVKNCNMIADGYGDVKNTDGSYTMYSVCTISSGKELTLEGGTYRAAREALSIYGYARINGGVFEGCQHGGAYLCGHDVRIKNATFRSIPYFGDCGWDDRRFGACYCGNNGVATNIYFDSCRFEREMPAGGNGITNQYANTKTYISNSVFGEGFNNDLRADKDTYIYIGENVVYDTIHPGSGDMGIGEYDTETYAGQSFAW